MFKVGYGCKLTHYYQRLNTDVSYSFVPITCFYMINTRSFCIIKFSIVKKM